MNFGQDMTSYGLYIAPDYREEKNRQQFGVDFLPLIIDKFGFKWVLTLKFGIYDLFLGLRTVR